MTTLLKYSIVFGGGIAVGLLLAREYARREVNTTIHDGLAAVGLADGFIERTAQGLITPNVVN